MDYKEYENTSEHKVRELKRFREKYVYKEIIVENTRWEYIFNEGGEKSLVLLPSGVHFGEMWFEVINRLQDKYTIISPSFPVVNSMEDVLKGIYAIIGKHDMNKTAIAGMSTSGWIAQCFVRKYKQMVDKLILINTSAPDKALVDSIKDAMTKTQNDHLHHINKGLEKFYLSLPLEEKEKEFLRVFLNELLSKTTKKLVLGLYNLTYDFMCNYRFTQDDLIDWNGTVMIMESDDDNGYNKSTSKVLRDLYQGAFIYVFNNAGHAPVFSRTDEFIKVLEDYLN